MNFDAFIEKIAVLFEETPATELTPETRYKELPDWTSLVALSLIVLAFNEFEATISGDDIEAAQTLGELFERVKKESLKMENSPFSLAGKSILVTGASSGIGRACAIESAKLGAKILATGRDEERLAETLSQVKTEGSQAVSADLLEFDFCKKIAAAVPEDAPLDGIVFPRE